MGFAVLHIEKGKSGSTGLQKHIDRLKHVPNADQSLTHLNFKVIPKGQQNDSRSFAIRIAERIKKGRKSNKAIRVVI